MLYHYGASRITAVAFGRHANGDGVDNSRFADLGPPPLVWLHRRPTRHEDIGGPGRQRQEPVRYQPGDDRQEPVRYQPGDDNFELCSHVHVQEQLDKMSGGRQVTLRCQYGVYDKPVEVALQSVPDSTLVYWEISDSDSGGGSNSKKRAKRKREN